MRHEADMLCGPIGYLGHFSQRRWLVRGHNVTFGRAGIVEDLEPGPTEGYTNETGPSRARTDQKMLQAPADDTADTVERGALSEKWHESETGMQKSERGTPKARGT